ncbi:MAG: Protein of unknown function DUF2213 Sinorhizobium meliloti AK83 gb [Candidatus Magnetoglobus multicellularis str. Araruama]|uniref:Uncharacterized protein n=1 Tax=Candidatus Magnetoglobus multicellularis str. Araruama TaxID=890399 RepID=A0A1V1PDI8_9BACT|nr:MAG: Protein of unknown function DUF2213 Sinorhizobium meliloti AK83 gb [Candidatus Magnetoglobus multicellularis str. Araruama]
MKKLFYDKLDSQQYTKDEKTGFLKAEVTLSRIGIQDYYGYELNHDIDGLTSDKIYPVYRSPETVFDKDSLESFNLMTVTNDHVDMVTVDNIKSHQVGTVGNITHDKEVVRGQIVITDQKTIEEIEQGKNEVSVGYEVDIIESKGFYRDKHYEYEQTNIRGNHLAIVDKGRCGGDCKITKDGGLTIMKSIKINGVDYQIEDGSLFQAMTKYMADAEEIKAKAEETEEELKKKRKRPIKQKRLLILFRQVMTL